MVVSALTMVGMKTVIVTAALRMLHWARKESFIVNGSWIEQVQVDLSAGLYRLAAQGIYMNLCKTNMVGRYVGMLRNCTLELEQEQNLQHTAQRVQLASAHALPKSVASAACSQRLMPCDTYMFLNANGKLTGWWEDEISLALPWLHVNLWSRHLFINKGWK